MTTRTDRDKLALPNHALDLVTALRDARAALVRAQDAAKADRRLSADFVLADDIRTMVDTCSVLTARAAVNS